MARYIDADELIQFCTSKLVETKDDEIIQAHNNAFRCMREYIKSLPSADVAKVKHGEWQYHSNPDSHINPEDAYCSNCGFWVCTSETSNFDDYNFCPYCGADMQITNEE